MSRNERRHCGVSRSGVAARGMAYGSWRSVRRPKVPLIGKGGRAGGRRGVMEAQASRDWMALAAGPEGAAATAKDGGRRLTAVSGLVVRRMPGRPSVPFIKAE